MKINDLKEKISDDWFEHEDAFVTFKKPTKEPYEIADQDGMIDTLEGPVSYQKGFYIMTGPQKEKYPISPEKFHELKIDNKDGTASPKKILKKARIANHDGKVKTSWGDFLMYNKNKDYIVKHGSNDYGVVKKDIFHQTYDTSQEPKQ